MHIVLDNHRQKLALEPISPRDYPASTIECARFFLGCILLRAHATEDGLLKSVLAGMIIETEAYTHDDPASHSYRGRSPRNQAMFSKIGNLYVYRSYGIHHCANIVTNSKGDAVLIRSLFPLAGSEEMLERRNLLYKNHIKNIPITNKNYTQLHQKLCRGPGNLSAAMKIDMGHNFQPLYHSGSISQRRSGEFAGLYKTVSMQNLPEFTEGLLDQNYAIKQSTRVGISKNKEALWRYFMDIPGYISHSRAGYTIG